MRWEILSTNILFILKGMVNSQYTLQPRSNFNNMPQINFLSQLKSKPQLAHLLSFTGAAVYLIQAWIYSHTLASVLDEGLYLFKGLLFATGRYTPFQDYGPWTNHMPLSFLIPGFIQNWFGLGIRTGRYFYIMLGLLMLLGIWILARRWGGAWWAAAAVWIMAINPAIIKIYSQAASQALVACMLTWVLVLCLKDTSSTWQLILGSILAGLVMLTRINLTPLLPLLWIYIFWQHGSKRCAWSLFAGISTVLIGHAVFWPEILRIWAAWVPIEVAPFLRSWARPENAVSSWNPDIAWFDRVVSFFFTVRHHFLTFTGVVAALILWPSKNQWKSIAHYKAATFLLALFFTLLLLHMWASLANNYCVYCLENYYSFFSVVGLLLVIITFQSWQQQPSILRQIISVFILLSLTIGIGLSLFNLLGKTLNYWGHVTNILNSTIPYGLKNFVSEPDKFIWEYMAEFVNHPRPERAYRKMLSMSLDLSKKIYPSILGLLAGVVILLTAWILKKIQIIKFPASPFGYGYILFVLFLLVGVFLSPTFILGGDPTVYDCGWDVIKSYEISGDQLAELIPDNALIYWQGDQSPIPLMYLSGIKIFPPQLNGKYSYRLDGDTDDLLKYGYWNSELERQWINEADYVLIEVGSPEGFAQSAVQSNNFSLIGETSPVIPCRTDSSFQVFKRKD
jgi:hypothetical protein